jgi:hypothetical protein
MSQQPPAHPFGEPPQGPSSTPPVPQQGWTPAPLSDGSRPSVGARPTVTSAPGAPLGGPSLRSVSIDEFAPPRSRLPLLVTLVVLVVAGLIWGATLLRPAPSAPVARPSASASPTPTSTAPGLPFVSPDERFSGRWEIVEHHWTDSGLEVQIMVAADRGPVNYSFVAFNNAGVDPTESVPGSEQPQFSGEPIPSGQKESGWLFFAIERGPTTIILATSGGNQMSALPVAG